MNKKLEKSFGKSVFIFALSFWNCFRKLWRSSNWWLSLKLVNVKVFCSPHYRELPRKNLSWRLLEHVFCLRLWKTSSRLFQDSFKMSSSRLIYLPWSRVFKSSYKDIFKTSSRPIQSLFKTSSKCVSEFLQKLLQDVFKM